MSTDNSEPAKPQELKDVADAVDAGKPSKVSKESVNDEPQAKRYDQRFTSFSGRDGDKLASLSPGMSEAEFNAAKDRLNSKSVQEFAIDFGDGTVESASGRKPAGGPQQYPKNDVVAQDVPMPWQIEPALNQAARDGVMMAVEVINQQRAIGEVNKIPDRAWSEAYNAFAGLQSHLPEKAATALMKAVIANEVEHYDPADVAEDALARSHLIPPDRTIGITQLTINAIRQRELEFPMQLAALREHEREALLDPAKAPSLVAATLEHYIRQFEKHQYPITSETLGYAYNPDLYTSPGHKNIMPTLEDMKKSEHAANIRRWLTAFSG